MLYRENGQFKTSYQADQQIDNLRIVNPFQADIGLLDATP